MTNEQISWMSLYRKRVNKLEDAIRHQINMEYELYKKRSQKSRDESTSRLTTAKFAVSAAKRAAENYVIENPYPKTEG
jgi:hypothetical protein